MLAKSLSNVQILSVWLIKMLLWCWRLFHSREVTSFYLCHAQLEWPHEFVVVLRCLWRCACSPLLLSKQAYLSFLFIISSLPPSSTIVPRHCLAKKTVHSYRVTVWTRPSRLMASLNTEQNTMRCLIWSFLQRETFSLVSHCLPTWVLFSLY